MALRAKVLQKKAEKFELKKLKAFEITKERLSALEPLLQEVYVSRRPVPSDYEVRRELVHVFNVIAKVIYGNSKDIPVVVEFGSFVMDLFSPTSDLDLSVNFRSADSKFPREKKIQTLRKFARKLYAIQSKGHVCRVLPVTSAKVPILKCVDRGTGVECDISVENRDGIMKSRIIRIISSIDERFQKLGFLMKTWAKAHNINSSKDKTLNSLSIILLVAFHLQTRNPPILPPFSVIFKDGTDPAIVEKSMPNFANYGERNKESLAELFLTLLIKLSSVEKLWPKGLCASTRTATWTSRTWDSKVACISVEDFTDHTQNVARAVGPGEVKQIYKCIEISLRRIVAFMDGQIGVQLRELLFGQDGKSAPIPGGSLKLPCNPSQARLTGKTVTGKKRKWAKRHNFAFTNKIIPLEGYQKAESPSQKPVVRSVGFESASLKKTRTDAVWRGNGSWGGTHDGWEVTQKTDEGGWGTQSANKGGWGGTHRTIEEDSEGTQRSGGWGGGWPSRSTVEVKAGPADILSGEQTQITESLATS